jgi:hypothetical protein
MVTLCPSTVQYTLPEPPGTTAPSLAWVCRQGFHVSGPTLPRSPPVLGHSHNNRLSRPFMGDMVLNFVKQTLKSNTCGDAQFSGQFGEGRPSGQLCFSRSGMACPSAIFRSLFSRLLRYHLRSVNGQYSGVICLTYVTRGL